MCTEGFPAAARVEHVLGVAFSSRWNARGMSASMPWSPAPPPPPNYDPNALLSRIDQTTTQIFHWVRIGVVVLIVLVLVSVVI
jgi:hypothetical protein